MALDANALDSFTTIGNREDLADIIYNISPTETPFMMMCGRGRAKATKHEWQIDTLADAVATNAVLEGDDAVMDTKVLSTRLANYTQISDKALIITGTQEVVDKAGRKSELAYQLAKRAKELKRDLEAQMTSNTASVVGDATTARQSASLRAWIATNDDINGGSSGGWGGTVTAAATPGTARAFLESDLKSVIQSAWTSGGDPTVIMVGAFNKRVASGFTGNSTRFDRGEDKRLVAAIDVYVSDFGEHRLVPNRFQDATFAYVLTPRLWSCDYLRSFRQHPLSKAGDHERRQLIVEYTLRSSNEAGSGCVADLTTS
jgi:hypothetical protein